MKPFFYYIAYYYIRDIILSSTRFNYLKLYYLLPSNLYYEELKIKEALNEF